MSASFDLRIDELVFAGFDPIDSQRLGRALERDLARLLGERGVPRGLTRSQNVSTIITRPVDLSAAAPPEAIAAELARAIYDGLSR